MIIPSLLRDLYRLRLFFSTFDVEEIGFQAYNVQVQVNYVVNAFQDGDEVSMIGLKMIMLQAKEIATHHCSISII